MNTTIIKSFIVTTALIIGSQAHGMFTRNVVQASLSKYTPSMPQILARSLAGAGFCGATWYGIKLATPPQKPVSATKKTHPRYYPVKV